MSRQKQTDWGVVIGKLVMYALGIMFFFWLNSTSCARRIDKTFDDMPRRGR